jgi:biopolymer transport protein ExbB
MGLIETGGWVIVVLLGLSIASVAIVIEKLWVLNATKVPQQLLSSVLLKLSTQSNTQVCQDLWQMQHVAGRIAATTIEKKAMPPHIFSTEIANVTRNDTKQLTSRINFLSVIITTAPVLGLLGTVLGLMDVFSAIAMEGTLKAELLSAGISKALITTVAGLALSVPLMFIHQYLESKIDDRLNDWDDISVQLLTALHSGS